MEKRMTEAEILADPKVPHYYMCTKCGYIYPAEVLEQLKIPPKEQQCVRCKELLKDNYRYGTWEELTQRG